jgi:MarR family transcriptional regulator, transcriptional regulator for hemolysin
MKESPLVRQPELITWFLLTDVSRIIRQMVDSEMRALGLTRAQWYLLTHTYYYEGMTQQQLADLMDLGKSSTAKLIHKLEKKNWVVRESDPDDARIARVSLTPRMHTTIRELTRLCAMAIRHVFQGLSEHEAEHLVSLLRKVEMTLSRERPAPSKELELLRGKLVADLQGGGSAAPRTRAKPRRRKAA